jgi:hypothetical protein
MRVYTINLAYLCSTSVLPNSDQSVSGKPYSSTTLLQEPAKLHLKLYCDYCCCGLRCG